MREIVAALLVAPVLASAPAITLAVNARALQPGELVVLTVTTSEPVAGVRGTAFGRPLVAARIDDTTWRALIGIDLDVPAGPHDIVVEAGAAAAPARATRRINVVPKPFPTRRLTVNPDFVNPPATVLARIDADAQRLAALWRASTSGGSIWWNRRRA